MKNYQIYFKMAYVILSLIVVLAMGGIIFFANLVVVLVGVLKSYLLGLSYEIDI